MKNNTLSFTILVQEILSENSIYFSHLEGLKNENYEHFNEKIMSDLKLSYCYPYNDIVDLLTNAIKTYISDNLKICDMQDNMLTKIEEQLEIDYRTNKTSKDDAELYHSIVTSLTYYGIYHKDKTPSFSNVIFWKELIKLLYILNLADLNRNSSHYNDLFIDHELFNRTYRFTLAKKHIEEKLNESIESIDGVVNFKKGQEDRIVKKIERKLHLLNLFDYANFIFNRYEKDKETNKINVTIPYKYIINIIVKNISKSKNKNKDIKKMHYITDLLTSFISLYQLKEDQFKMMNTSVNTIVDHLKQQVIYSNFYPLYHLKTNTLIEYIENIIKPCGIDELLFTKFGFSIENLIFFIKSLDSKKNNVILIDESLSYKNISNICDFFSIDANEINKNYSSLESLPTNENIFSMNPIIKYKGKHFIIGFEYFKMNIYNSFVDKIRKNIDPEINIKIGGNIDSFVEKTFCKIKNKHGFEVFSGNYTPPKNENPESDLLLKSKDDIILIENKNKYLTGNSFSGSKHDILKDFILSFVTSQIQLLKHERNLIVQKTIRFKKSDKRLNYEGQNIVKLSVSTNNWYNIMNNPSSIILNSIRNLEFKFEDNKKYKNHSDYIKANKYLSKLDEIMTELEAINGINIATTLTQTTFLPLELIIDKYNDDDFINNLKSLVSIKMNTDNVLNIYDYYVFLKESKNASKHS
ncbi:hypothetical protein [Morganella morganii]|uniref:hypothetical protein n=1 Tax=Morganella morganii TaxID=582 RepID=UPI0013CA7A49|nr:hypothetical protein [Morganella morganii]ELB1016311.1 hypothetical protein [Morganella morganii]NGE93558.1 hypothetical protein [Morganella morganii]